MQSAHCRNDADGCLPFFLDLSALRYPVQTEVGRLLRVLQLRLGALPAHSAAARRARPPRHVRESCPVTSRDARGSVVRSSRRRPRVPRAPACGSGWKTPGGAHRTGHPGRPAPAGRSRPPRPPAPRPVAARRSPAPGTQYCRPPATVRRSVPALDSGGKHVDAVADWRDPELRKAGQQYQAVELLDQCANATRLPGFGISCTRPIARMVMELLS